VAQAVVVLGLLVLLMGHHLITQVALVATDLQIQLTVVKLVNWFQVYTI